MRIEGPWFKDDQGRTLILRGINLGGSTKVPLTPNGATHIRKGFFDHRSVSFLGRPFPLEEADEHFSRLKHWGYTFLRFLITWEAIEHQGPGMYDEDYLDYLVQIVRKAGEYGISLFIDPHQDVWSRFSGGDGAPGWTFDSIGMDITKFAETGAAIVHATHGDPFPRMIWPTNYSKLACATMFTLFFAGNDFAPRTLIENTPIQEYLQTHYIEAIKQVALRLKEFPNVIGYDTLNEPHSGFIRTGFHDNWGLLSYGMSPTPWQAILLGAGYPQEVSVYKIGITGFRQMGTKMINLNRERVWKDGSDCIWKKNGIWEADTQGVPQLLRSDHFLRVNGRDVSFSEDYFKPFANRFTHEIRSIKPDTIIFIESVPGLGEEQITWDKEDFPQVVNATHWYDDLTLFFKRFFGWFSIDIRSMKLMLGRSRVRQMFIDQIASIKENSDLKMGNCPTLIGEFGIPFDMKHNHAFISGNFSRQERALDASYCAIEANLVNSTLWNYTSDNTNQRGDQWNGEDLSIFSRDQQTEVQDINDGGRALRAAVRPYARTTAGEPLMMSFNIRSGDFEFHFRHDPIIKAATEFYIPNLQYPEGYDVHVTDGSYKVDMENQTLTYHHTHQHEVHIVHIQRS
jgi:hypothetical protein